MFILYHYKYQTKCRIIDLIKAPMMKREYGKAGLSSPTTF